jgi:peptidyl-prolyl cis-trans isomerase D
MLDRMRRHRNWLKWSLALVCLAFVIFYIPDFVQQGTGVAVTDAVAVIDGEEISAEAFRRVYQAELQQYQQSSGGQVTAQILKSLGIDRRILEEMIDEHVATAEAARLGISVSDAEVAQRILAIPALQQNGVFIGAARYQQLLASQSPPLTTTEFEGNLRRSLAADKLRKALTGWLSVSDRELSDEYRRRNDKVKLAVVAFTADRYRADVNPSDADVSTYFDSHTTDFRIPEKRKIKYALIEIEALRSQVTVTQADIESLYNETVMQEATPEQIRASHILLRTEGKDEAAVKTRAEDVLKQAKAPGADFAALAKKYSEDETNAANGGDLDFFARGRMVPEFDTAAFALEPGQVSDLVRTEYGFHIIKVTDKKPATVRKLEEVKDQLTMQLTNERAQARATAIATAMEAQIRRPADLEAAARAQGLTVQETGFFARNEPLISLGSAPEVAERAFTMNIGDVAGPLRSDRGLVFATVTEKRDSYIPKLEEVKDQVREAVIKQRALMAAQQKAAEAVVKLKAAADFEKAAKAANLEARSTELITKDGVIPELGAAPEVMEAAFKLAPGSVSDPITTDSGIAIVKVLEKSLTSDADLAAAKESFREELLSDRRSRFYSAYMAKVKQKMRIQINPEALQKVIG